MGLHVAIEVREMTGDMVGFDRGLVPAVAACLSNYRASLTNYSSLTPVVS